MISRHSTYIQLCISRHCTHRQIQSHILHAVSSLQNIFVLHTFWIKWFFCNLTHSETAKWICTLCEIFPYVLHIRKFSTFRIQYGLYCLDALSRAIAYIEGVVYIYMLYTVCFQRVHTVSFFLITPNDFLTFYIHSSFCVVHAVIQWLLCRLFLPAQ